MPLASALQFQDYQFSIQTLEGSWRWTTRVDVSGPFPQYSVRDIFTPFGLIRDRVPIPGEIIQAMAESITELQASFPPSILLAPTSVTFTLDEGRGVSDPETIQITNSGVFGSLLSASLTTSASYLDIAPPQVGNLAFNEAGTFDLTADSTNLLATASPYLSTVMVQDATASNTPQSVAVTVVVRPKATILLLPVLLTFTVVKPPSGPFPPIPTQTFQIQNTGLPTSVLEFLVQKLTGCGTWIVGINPFMGSIPGGGTQVVVVSVAPDASLPVGTYTETLRVSGYSSNFYQDIVVTLNVT